MPDIKLNEIITFVQVLLKKNKQFLRITLQVNLAADIK